jgi:hypothetical protein
MPSESYQTNRYGCMQKLAWGPKACIVPQNERTGILSCQFIVVFTAVVLRSPCVCVFLPASVKIHLDQWRFLCQCQSYRIPLY